MGIISTPAYKCDFADCGHIWLAKIERARCAKCKRRNWNKNGTLQTQAPLLEPVVAKPKKTKKVLHDQSAEPAEPLLNGFNMPAVSNEVVAEMKLALEPEPEKSEQFAAALKALTGPKPKVGEMCPHGWASYLQCPKCNERMA